MMMIFIVALAILAFTSARRVSRSSAALRRQREWLQVTLSSIGDAVLATDTAGKITFLNPVAEALTGWKGQEVLGRPVQEVFRVINEQTRQPADDIVAHVLREGAIVTLANHTAIQTRAGREIPIEDSAAPIKDADAKITGVVLVFHDVTQKRRAQEALRESEERERLRALELQAVLETAPIAIWIAHDPDCRKITGNAAADRLLQAPRSANVSASAAPGEAAVTYKVFRGDVDLRPEQMPAQFAAATGRPVIGEELDMVFADGRRIHLIESAVPLFDADGRVRGAIIAGQDITERKQAEEERQRLQAVVQEERDRLSALIDSISDEIWFADADARLTLVNRAVIKEFGLSGSDATEVAKVAASFEVLRPDGTPRPAEEAPPLRALRGEVVKDQEELVRTPATGQFRHRQVSAAPVRDAAGNIIGSVSVVRDITDLKRVENRLAADVTVLTRLHALSVKILETSELEPLLQEIMEAAVIIVGAQKGTLQLVEGDSLAIVAHHGHDRPFLDFFAKAENVASVCGEATKRGERVVVEDVEASPLFIGTPSLPVLRNAGVRAVQSTPLVSRQGELLGILTTQWGVPYTPDEHDLWRIDLLARQAADMIEQARAEKELRKSRDELEVRVKERTAALESSRRLLRSIIDHTPPLVYVFDREERFLVANQALGDLLEKPPDEIIGKRRHEFMLKEIADRDEENDRKVIAAGVPVVFEEAGSFRDGKVTTFLTVKFPIRGQEWRNIRGWRHFYGHHRA